MRWRKGEGMEGRGGKDRQANSTGGRVWQDGRRAWVEAGRGRRWGGYR